MENFDLEIPREDLEKLEFEDVRSRCFCGILYPEDVTQHFAMFQLFKNTYKCVYISHNQDIDNDGNLKKEHIHFIIRFSNARYRNTVAKELKILPCYIQPCSSFNSYCTYILHIDEPFKHQYQVVDVQGSLFNDFLKAVQNVDSEQIKVMKIMRYLESLPLRTKRSDILTWICANSLYDTYKRGYSIFRDILNQKDGYL